MSRILCVPRVAVAASVVVCLLQTLRAQAADAPPNYTPHPVSPGVITVYGSDLAGLVKSWEQDFSRLHPGISFQSRFPSSDGWSAGMEAADADIGTSGREPVLAEYLSFDETFGYNPTEIAVATGAYARQGRTYNLGWIARPSLDNASSPSALRSLPWPSLDWRRGWDSNPRNPVKSLLEFQSSAFDRSATSPHSMSH